MEDERFDINATIPEGTPPLTLPAAMIAMRRVLADRFGVRVRAQTVEGPLYRLIALSPAPNTATRLRPSTAACAAAGVVPGRGAGVSPCDAIRIKGGERFVMEGIGVLMPQLAATLSGSPVIARPVIDGTGLQGRYDFSLEFVPPGTAAEGPSLFAALEEQFGLKLEPGRGPIEQLVIEAADRPSPN